MRVTTSLIPVHGRLDTLEEVERLLEVRTRIFCILWTDIFIASVENILVHQRCSWCYLSKEGHLDRLSNLYPLALLHEDLAGILAPIFSVKTRYTILFRMVPLFEGLESSHEIMPTCNTRRDNALGDASSNSTFDNCGDGVHGAYDLRLKLRGHVEFDLLEQILRSSETSNDEYVLTYISMLVVNDRVVLGT